MTVVVDKNYLQDNEEDKIAQENMEDDDENDEDDNSDNNDSNDDGHDHDHNDNNKDSSNNCEDTIPCSRRPPNNWLTRLVGLCIAPTNSLFNWV